MVGGGQQSGWQGLAFVFSNVYSFEDLLSALCAESPGRSSYPHRLLPLPATHSTATWGCVRRPGGVGGGVGGSRHGVAHQPEHVPISLSVPCPLTGT